MVSAIVNQELEMDYDVSYRDVTLSPKRRDDRCRHGCVHRSLRHRSALRQEPRRPPVLYSDDERCAPDVTNQSVPVSGVRVIERPAIAFICGRQGEDIPDQRAREFFVAGKSVAGG